MLLNLMFCLPLGLFYSIEDNTVHQIGKRVMADNEDPHIGLSQPFHFNILCHVNSTLSNHTFRVLNVSF